jgi:hypothetical protein
MRGHEDDGRGVGAVAHERGRFHTGEPRHLDVEEDDIGRRVARKSERRDRVLGLADDVDAVLAEEVPQLRPGGRLVVDDQGADGTSSRTTVPNGNERSLTLSP